MANTVLSRPATGGHISIPAETGATIVLDFIATQSTLERSNDNLVFRFDDGADVVIENFYTTFGQQDIPQFEVDGQLVSGADFFNAFGPDLIPAAGPDAASQRSARYNENADSDLASGVDHLDGLDMSVSGTEAPTAFVAFDSAPLAGGGDGNIAPPPPPPPPYAPFVRAVLYTPGNTGAAVGANIFFSENGNSPFAIPPGSMDFSGSAPWAQYGISATLPEGWSQNWVNISLDSYTGRLEFRLTPEGVAEMQRLGLNGEDLVNIIRISVTDRHSGNTFDYNVEFVATVDPEFDSAAHTAKHGNEAGLDSIGEFHYGRGTNGQYSIISSDKNDEIILADTLQGGSSIHASGSADPAHMANDYNTIKLYNGAQANEAGKITHITSTDGVLTSNGGILATAQGSGNDIDMGTGKVDISSYGLKASNGGENRITGADITVRGTSGIDSSSGGKNILDAGDNGNVTINNASTALKAEGKESLIDVHGGKVDIAGYYDGVSVDSKGTANISGGTVNITATNGRTVKNWTDGTININADDEVNLRLTNASQSSAAIMTLSGTTTVKSGGDININVDKGTYQTSGINTWSRGTANVEAEKDINIKVHSEKGSGVTYGATGIEIGFTHGGRNNITSNHGDIKLDIDASASGVYGITTSGYDNKSDGITTISAKEGTLDIKASATNDSYYAHGIASSGYGKNVIDAGGLNVDVSLVKGSNSDGYASTTGIAATYDGRRGGINNIDVSGHTDVHVQGGGNTSGIYTRGNGQNTINTDTLRVDVTSTGVLANSRATGIESSGGSNVINVTDNADILVTSKDLAAGLYSTSGTLNLTAGDHVDVSVTSTAGAAYGIYGPASLTAQSVSMTIKGDLSAIVMENGTLTASEVRLNAESSSGNSYGMHSTSYYGNTIQSGSSQALDLEINADYAMHATYGKNSIIGHSTAGGEGDTIRLNGDIFKSGNGQNQITTGAGDDTIIINGAISGAGALQVDGGAGADTLILEASSLSEFLDRYADWLNGLNPSILKGVESILFTGIDDLSELRPGLDSFFSYVNSVQPPIEVGLQQPDGADISPLAFALQDDWQSDTQQDEDHNDDHARTTDTLFAPDQGEHAAGIDTEHALDAFHAGKSAAESDDAALDLTNMASLQKNGGMPDMGPSGSSSVWNSVMDGSWQDSSLEDTPPGPSVGAGTEHESEMAIIETAARTIENG